eukprot:gi/632968474/ref/XP_007900546.1/ PREDICTED: ras-like protein family member 10B [Callorhinchus milii]
MAAEVRSTYCEGCGLFDIAVSFKKKMAWGTPGCVDGEWSDSRCRGVRSANAYVLVYDICCLDSFEYVKMIRQQITDLRTSNNSHKVPIIVVGNKRDLQKQRFARRRSLCVLVKKVWKCGYIECSAKYNWHVLLLFKELLSSTVERGYKHSHASICIQGALQGNRCSVM